MASDSDDDNTDGVHVKLAKRHWKVETGQFQGDWVVRPESPYPGMLGTLTIAFVTHHAIPIYSRFTLQFPSYGWKLSSKTPRVILQTPTSGEAPRLDATWSSAKHLLECTLIEGRLLSNAPLHMIISGVHTPSSATSQADLVISCYEKLIVRKTVPPSTRGGQCLDGPCTFTLPTIIPGELTGEKRWTPFTCLPSVVSDVTLRVDVHGSIPIGGKLLIDLPSSQDWDMDIHPEVSIKSKSQLSITASWDSEHQSFEITFTSIVAAGSSLHLTIFRVKNPTTETWTGKDDVTNARLTTVDANGGVIDGPSKLEMTPISELKASDLALMEKSLAVEGSDLNRISVSQLPTILERTGIKLSEENYTRLVVEKLPLKEVDTSIEEETTIVAPEIVDSISWKEALNLFAILYAPAHKCGQHLRLACGRGRIEEVTEWIERGCDANVADGSGWTALHYAAEYGQIHVLDTLAAILLNTDASTAFQRPTLQVNRRDADGWTALMCAAANGHNTAVKKLVGMGADVHLTDIQGRTALHWAATRGKPSTIRVLIELGADMNQVDRSGWTAYHCSAVHANGSCMVTLGESGADTQLQDILGHAPEVYGGDKLLKTVTGTVERPRDPLDDDTKRRGSIPLVQMPLIYPDLETLDRPKSAGDSCLVDRESWTQVE